MITKLHDYLLDPFERAGSTFFEALFVGLLLFSPGSVVAHQAWGPAADAAGFSALTTLLLAYATILFGLKFPGAWDYVRRYAYTFVAAVVGILTASGTHSVVHTSWTGVLAMAFYTTISAFVKTGTATVLPWSAGASLLPLPKAVHQRDAAALLAQHGFTLRSDGVTPVPLEVPAPIVPPVVPVAVVPTETTPAAVVEAPRLRPAHVEDRETPKHSVV